MKPSASFGIETTDAHFSRAGFPLQGWMLWTTKVIEENNQTEIVPMKTVTHFLAEDGVKSNKVFP